MMLELKLGVGIRDAFRRIVFLLGDCMLLIELKVIDLSVRDVDTDASWLLLVLESCQFLGHIHGLAVIKIDLKS
jgi:hypothetical protein